MEGLCLLLFYNGFMISGRALLLGTLSPGPSTLATKDFFGEDLVFYDLMTAIECKLHDHVQISSMTFGHGLNQILYLCKSFGCKQSATWDWVLN